MRRPYVKLSIDWCSDILDEWSRQVKTRPRETVVQMPGQGIPTNLYVGGKEPDGIIPYGGKSMGKRINARGTNTRSPGASSEPIGYSIQGLTGKAAIADRVVLRIAGVDSRCAWVLRAQYGLIPDLEGVEEKQRATHLGIYLDGHAWPSSAYQDRLSRSLQMFAVGYLSSI